jgi:serine-type D-Ala-D-Ala carboxypeptidase/endopeptidase (penicillin-binding protein 4)
MLRAMPVAVRPLAATLLAGACLLAPPPALATRGTPPTPMPMSVAPRPDATASSTALDGSLGHELATAGVHSGAYVYDITAKTPLFSERADIARAPASVEKLYTATTALELMGAAGTLDTRVLGTGRLGPEGRWEGDLYLRGGGDPTFGSAPFIARWYGGRGTSIQKLAEQLVRVDGIRSVTGRVDGDESFLDSLRGDPSSGYRTDPELAGSLSGLEFNRGEHGSERGPHAQAAYAARQLRGALRALGVKTGTGAAASAPPGARLLAQARSPSIATLLGLMLPPSDNYFAETLIKDLGARFGGAGSTAAGARVVRATIAKLLGIHPRILDGSGLSHSDASTPREIVSLLTALAPTQIGATLRGDLAVPGGHGTLEDRMRGTPAAGRCQAKTGTLDGVSNIAGYCRAQNGDEIAFAFFTDGIEDERAHTIQDNMTITLARY